MLNIPAFLSGVPHTLPPRELSIPDITRKAPSMLPPVTAERFRVRLYMARVPTLSMPHTEVLLTLFRTLVLRVTLVACPGARRLPMPTNIAPIEPVAVRHRPTSF